jgi:hypothetical protein
MSKTKKSIIEVRGAAISIVSQKEQDYISLTDIARFKSMDRFDDLIRNWLRNRNTVEFLGVWERLNNPDFNPVEFDGIRIQAGRTRHELHQLTRIQFVKRSWNSCPLFWPMRLK